MKRDPAALLARHGVRAGIVLGSGLGGVARALEDPTMVPYDELAEFPAPGVEGHAGRLVIGRLGSLGVACFAGRTHFYESGSGTGMAGPIRALRRAGAEFLVLTNAAGSLRTDIGPGRLMLISDHINLIPGNPIAGPNDDAIGPRFPSMRDCYDPGLRQRLREAALRTGIDVADGVYLACAGPSFETAAEIRAFRVLGADAVGMSIAPETIIARHCGLRVAALSVITNLAEGLGTPLSHEETLSAASSAAARLAALLGEFCREMAGAV